MENQLVPKLRFPGFKGEWEKKIFGDFVSNKSRKYNPISNKKVYKCIELEHIDQNTGRLLGHTTTKETNSTKNVFERGQVLYGKLRPYLNKYYYTTFNGVCSSEIWVLNGIKIENKLLAQLTQTNYFKYIARKTTGSKMPRMDWSVLSDTEFCITYNLYEQQKIADYLSLIDSKLNLLEEKKAELSRYKKAMMQKLFSQEIRFKDENGKDFPDWEEKRLGEIFKEVKDKVQSSNIPTYSISAGKGFVSQQEKFGRDISGKQNENYIVLKYGDFSYNKGNSKKYFYGCVYRSNFNYEIAVPNVFISFQAIFEKEVYTGFYAQLFENHYLDRYLRRLISSSARMDGLLNVAKGDFFKILVPIPLIQEQQKIADFLSAIDDNVNKVEEQIQQTLAFKKAMLQQMFV